jgi:hypothetical protein
MSLQTRFHETLRAVEASRQFVPFIGGEAERLERCAIAAKRVCGLADGAVADPYAVAMTLRIPVVGGREQFAVIPEPARSAMLSSRQWSAGTIEGPRGPLIVLNPMHADTRLRVTLAEEISHLVMGHPPSTITAGARTYVGTVEAEAFSVGGALVMPYKRLFAMVKDGASIDAIAAAFLVSRQMAQCRVNRTGLSRMQQKRVAAP